MKKAVSFAACLVFLAITSFAYGNPPSAYDPNCEGNCGMKEGMCKGSCLNRYNDGDIKSSAEYDACVAECTRRADACVQDCRWK